MDQYTPNVIPIPGADNPNRTYLEIVPDPEWQRVIIQPGASGRRLPKFWQVWVRAVLLDITPVNHVTSVHFDGDRIYLRSSRSLGATLNMAERAAKQIRSFPMQPLIRWRRGWRDRFTSSWQLNPALVQLQHDATGVPDRIRYKVDRMKLAEKAQELCRTVQLPRGCRLSVDYWDLALVGPQGLPPIELQLTVGRKVKQRPAELRLLVEMHFTVGLFSLDQRDRQAA